MNISIAHVHSLFLSSRNSILHTLMIEKFSKEFIEDSIHKVLDNENSLSLDEMVLLLRKVATGYQMIACGIYEGQVFYRGIPYVDKPTKYEELIYPPMEKAKLNRAN